MSEKVYVCKLKFYYKKSSGKSYEAVGFAIGRPLVCLGLKFMRDLADCSPPQAAEAFFFFFFAERVGATMINVVIKPVDQLLSVTLDHVLRELGCVR